MMKFFLSAMLVLFSLVMHAQTRLTLRQCIETGLANNPDVLQSNLQAEADKVNMQQAKLNLLPDLNGSAAHNFSQGRSIDPYSNSPVTQNISSSNYSVNSSVVLFNGFARQNLIKRNSLDYQASKMDWQQWKDDVTIRIISAYMQVLNNEDQLSQRISQASLTAKQVERLEVQHKEGAISPQTLSDLKGQYAGEQFAVITMQNAVESAKINLCELMNIPYSKDIVLEREDPALAASTYDETPDKIYETALGNFAIIKGADLRKKSAEKNLKATKGLLFPTLSFGAGAGTSYSSIAFQNQYLNTTYVPTSDSAIVNNVKYPVYKFHDNFTTPTRISYKDQLDNNFSTYFGFNLSIPIFNSLRLRNNVRLAKITLKNRERQAKDVRTSLNRSVNQAYIDMTAASGSYKVLLDQVAAYGESFRIAEIRFNAGLGTTIDYLTAKNNLDRANISMISARYEYVLRTKVLDYYQGKQLW